MSLKQVFAANDAKPRKTKLLVVEHSHLDKVRSIECESLKPGSNNNIFSNKNIKLLALASRRYIN